MRITAKDKVTLLLLLVTISFQGCNANADAEVFLPGRVSGVPEFQVNTYTEGDQNLPQVARLVGGGSIVVWQSNGQVEEGLFAIIGQRYNADGTPLGDEITISVHPGNPTGPHSSPTVAGLHDGGFVVVWQLISSQRTYLRAQMFSPTAVPRFSHWLEITDVQLYSSCPPKVAGFNWGGFVVIWCTTFTSSTKLVSRRYTAQGKEYGWRVIFGGRYVVEKKPDITVFSDDRYIVTWTDLEEGGTSNKVFAEIFSGYYSSVPEFMLSSSDGAQMYSSVAVLPNDDFIAAWASLSGSAYEIYARRFNSAGVPLGDEWMVNEYTVNTQTKPSVASLTGGNYVITWESFGQDGQEYAVIVREFDGVTDQPISDEFVANTMAVGSQTQSGVVSHSDDSSQYFIVWSDSVNDGSGTGVFGTILGDVFTPPTQTAPVEEFQINTITTNYQRYPALCTLMNGGVVVAWESINDDIGIDIIIQIYTPEGERLGDPITVDTQHFTHYSPTLTSLPDGGFLVVFLTWEYLYDRTHFQRFTSTGVRVGGDIKDYESSMGKPSVAAFQSGGWVLTMPGLESLGISVALQRISSTGTQLGGRVYASIPGREVQSLGVRTHMLPTDQYLLTWSSGDQNSPVGVISVWGQLFTSSGVKIGDNIPLSATSTEQQLTPDAAVLTGGGFVAVWTSMDPTTGKQNIYSRRFANDGTALETTNRKLNVDDRRHSRNPRVTALNNGDYFVAWESWTADDSYLGVVGGQFGGYDNVPVTDVRVLNTNTPWNQEQVTVTRMGRDKIFAAWTDAKLDGDNSGIFGRVFEVAASPTSEEQVVNTGRDSVQSYPTVANLTSGGSVVCWQSYAYDGSGTGVFCQKYTPFGTMDGGEFQANTYTPDTQMWASAAGLPNGGFVVVWQTVLPGTTLRDIRGRVFSSSGPLGDDFRINTITNSLSHVKPSVCSLSTSGFVVTWDGSVGDITFVYAQMYSSDGTQMGPEIVMETGLPVFNKKSYPKIASFVGDNFVITFTDNDGDGSSPNVGISAQIFGASGQTVGSRIRVNANEFSTQFNSDVAVLSDGSFVVVWASYNYQPTNARHDIYFRRFTSLGVAIDDNDELVNIYFDSYQNLPRVAGLQNGGFVVAWDSWGADGNYYGASVREYTASGEALSTELVANTNTQGNQYHVVVSSFGRYGYVVAWDDPSLDGDRPGIVQRFYTKTYLGEI